MKLGLKVTKGYLEVEVDRDIINEIQDKLRKLSKEEIEAEKIRTAGETKPSSKTPLIGKLGFTPKMPI